MASTYEFFHASNLILQMGKLTRVNVVKILFLSDFIHTKT